MPHPNPSKRRSVAVEAASPLALMLTSCQTGEDLSVISDYPRQRYQPGSGDQVRIITFGEDQLTGEFRVDDEGDIELPLLGSLHAAGLTRQELDESSARDLQAAKLLRDASVSSEVFACRPIFVLGKVARPEPVSVPAGHDNVDLCCGCGLIPILGDRALCWDHMDDQRWQAGKGGTIARRPFDTCGRHPGLPKPIQSAANVVR